LQQRVKGAAELFWFELALTASIEKSSAGASATDQAIYFAFNA
jgi:hypothetical protein